MREPLALPIGGPSRRRPRRRRLGIASLIAMLYLLLFATLAVGFYAATTMSVQMSRNDRVVSLSQSAAEGGLGFARRQMTVAAVVPSTSDPAATFTLIYAALTARCAGTTNMGGYAPTRFTSSAGVDTICVPGHSGTSTAPTYNWMALGGGGGQTRLALTRSGNNVVVTSYGRSKAADPIVRAVQLTYKLVGGTWSTPGAGVLSRSPITMSNGAVITGGDVVSATTQAVTSLSLVGGARIANNFYYTANPIAPVINNGGTVSGTVYPNAAMPSFPAVDTTGFASFVPSATAAAGPKVLTATSSIASGAVLTNIRIKANANLTFQNNVQLNGVIYIESPNKITIASVQSVNGIIVTDNDTTKPISGNTLTINNGAVLNGLETLNAANFAASENIATLKTLAGALILAPNYKVTVAGGAQTFNGTMVASSWDISNGYRGTINGSLINLADTAFTMVGGGQITFTGGSKSIPGLGGGAKLSVDLGSYLEVTP